MRNSSFAQKSRDVVAPLNDLSGACVEYLIVPTSRVSIFKCYGSWSGKLSVIMLPIIFYFIFAQPFLLFYFFRTTKEFPKSWKEFKFEVLTIFCGLRSQNEDLFLMRRNRISWVEIYCQSRRSSSLNVYSLRFQNWYKCRTEFVWSLVEIAESAFTSSKSCSDAKWPLLWVRHENRREVAN